MKEILLSIVAISILATTEIQANSQIEIEQLKADMQIMSKKIEKATIIKSKVPILKISGKHYLGFVSSDEDGNYFETRRNYLQVKAYFDENSKDFFRITLDTNQIDDNKYSDANGNVYGKDLYGSWNVRLKYAYLYLDNILPFTGVEIGQAHRPWIDYEEHGGWNYRSISKVFVENGDAAHLTNSADIGINFQTKMEFFSSELGIFNGEGYHGIEDGEALSAEWRLTGHILGGGTHKNKKQNTYANISFFGQMNAESNKHKNNDLDWYAIHAVYNQPEFLIAAQYVSTEDAHSAYDGDGYSLNGEVRLTDHWNFIGRFDSWEMKEDDLLKERAIAGVTYKYNKNVEFIVNYLGTDIGDNYSDDALMVTTEINW